MLPIVWLLMVGLLAGLVFVFWAWVPYLVGGGVALVALVWIIVCALWRTAWRGRRCIVKVKWRYLRNI